MKTIHRFKSRTLVLGSLSIGLLSLAISATATPPPSGLAPATPPAGGFGIDGDLFARQPGAASSGDWVVDTNLTGTGGGVLTMGGVPLNPTTTFHFIDPYNDSSGDFIFTGGNKWADDPATWNWTSGKPSSKTDINNVLLHLASDTNGHTWAVIAADRSSTSGDSYIDFELLQNPLVRTNDGAFHSSGPDGGRTIGDMVLSLAFIEGGKVADFFAWRWLPDGSGGYEYVDVTSALPAEGVYVALNTTKVPVPYPAFGGTEYEANAFAEAAIDLTALLAGFDPCESFGFETIMVKTKASASYSAGIEDFIDPIAYKLQIGPSADAGEDQIRCADVAATGFALSGSASAGLTSVESVSWTVIAGSATVDDASALVTTARVSSASATLRLEVVQKNGCVDTDEVVLTAVTPPDATVSGANTLCPDSTATFTAPPAMEGYLWAISGNGSILGANDQESVTVTSGGICGEPIDLTLTVSSNVCTVSSTAEIIVEDTLPPLLTLPQNLVLECPADTRTNSTGVALATDDCGQVTLVYNDSQTNLCGASIVISREWIAMDSCGNTTSAVQTIAVQDTTLPVLSIPPDLTLECPANTTPAATGVATATDNCGNPAVSFSDAVTPGCGETRTITRTWSAIDDCGNLAMAVQTIAVQDTTLPVLSIPPDLTLECPADTDTTATGVAMATDNCGNPAVSFSDAVTPGCGETRTITRTWSAIDDCGNLATAVQTIAVQDTTLPVLSVPPDLTLECPANTETTVTGIASAEDACGTPTVTYVDRIEEGCGETKTITRTWSAIDDCGNLAMAVQTIAVQDTTLPVLSVPPDLTLECPADTDTTATGVALATDNCGNPAVSFSDAVTPGCGETRTITRTWSAIDDCGNLATAVQTIAVQDTTLPVPSVPPDLTLECPANTETAVTGIATAEDACGTPTVTYVDHVQEGCGGSKTIIRRWRATDECGNTTARWQRIEVRDTTPPALECPPFVTLEFGQDTDPDSTGYPQAQDACGNTTLSYTDEVIELCGVSKIIGRTWMASDECGNNSYCHQRITVRDTTPPTLSLPTDQTLECPANTNTFATGMATATDVSGEVAITHTDVVTEGPCGGSMSIARTWTATDVCNNSASGTQYIQVEDTTPPTIDCPDITVQCADDVPAPYTDLAAFIAGGGSASDTCDDTLDFILISDSGLVGSCPGIVTRVYAVSDNCGNRAQHTQTLKVDDTIAPTITCPGDATVECGTPLAPFATGRATATDNCDPYVSVSYSDVDVPSNYDIKWYAADPGPESGPYSPTYAKLAPTSLECPSAAQLTGRAIAPLRNAVAYAVPGGQLDALTSLGGEPMAFGQVVPFEAVIEVGGGPGPERGTLEFTSSWSTHTTSNDRFGYDTNYMVYCAFVDPSDPGTLDPHENARVEAFSSSLVNAGTSDETIQGTFRISGLESGDRVIVEIWVVLTSTKPDKVGGTIASDLVSAEKATDPPEPITVGSQTVSIGNLSKIKGLPPEETQLPQPPEPALPPQPPVPPGATVSVIDRTWTATDECGNQARCVQQITVRDTIAPEFTQDTLETVLAGDEEWTMEPPLAADGCGEVTVSLYSIETNLTASGSQMITYVWQAVDESGNTTLIGRNIEILPVSLPDPKLSIAWSGGQLAITWPSEPSGWWLESTPSLSDPDWNPVAIAPRLTNEVHHVEVTPDGTSLWFRLASGAPPLAMSASQSGMVSLTWPSLATGYTLEHCTNLASGSWIEQPATVLTANGLHHVEVEALGATGFFRLVNPTP